MTDTFMMIGSQRTCNAHYFQVDYANREHFISLLGKPLCDHYTYVEVQIGRR